MDATSGSTTINSYAESDEYGNQLPGSPAARYGWLGTHQRSSDSPGGLTLMGARLYNAGTGLFLQSDPVPGGGATRYGYPTDPINMLDLDGNMWGWVWTAAMHGVGLLAGALCDAAGPAAILCGVAIGAMLGAVDYEGYHHYVKHDSVSSTGLQKAMISGAISGAVGGLLSKTVAKKVINYWVGHGTHMALTVYHKLMSIGFHWLAAELWNIVYKMTTVLLKLAGS